MPQKFQKHVSKGTRFNQIYIPGEMAECFRPGSLVEVRLVEMQLHYHNAKPLTALKEKIVREIFAFLGHDRIFIVGSFLGTADYNDIDVIVITDASQESLEKQIKSHLGLNIHLLTIPEKKLEFLLASCPLTRNMFSSYVSNTDEDMQRKRSIDRKHIEFLLMMPEDLLEIGMSPKVFYDNLRRIAAIEQFLVSGKAGGTEHDVRKMFGKKAVEFLKDGIMPNIRLLRRAIRKNIARIRRLLEHGEKETDREDHKHPGKIHKA